MDNISTEMLLKTMNLDQITYRGIIDRRKKKKKMSKSRALGYSNIQEMRK